MILCVNEYQVKPGRMGRLLRELRKSRVEEELRKSQGNVSFYFSVPIQEEDTLYLTDSWKDEASFQAHLETKAAARWAALREEYISESIVRRYQV